MSIEDHSAVWKSCFTAWPDKVGRRGVLITLFNEEIPFSGFLTSDGLLLLERSIPDTSGARKVLVPYSQIAAVKLIDVVKAKALKPLGFTDGKTA